MTHTPWISLLALSLLASLGAVGASAETAGTLEIVDASLDTVPPAAAAYADIVAGRLELVDGQTLRATLELNALPEAQPGIAYVFVFRAGEDDHYLALAALPTTQYVHGRWAGEGPDTMEEASGSYAVGTPGVVTLEMPISVLPRATVLTDPLAYAVDVKGGVLPIGLPLPIGFVVLDEAAGEGELVVRAPDESADTGGDLGTASVAAAEAEAAPAGAAPTAEPAPGKAVPAPAALLVIVALALVARARAR